MKKLTTVAMIATMAAASAFAGDNTINVVGRAGWSWKDNDVKKTGTPNTSSFDIDYLRTTFAGAITPTVKYFATADFLGDSSSADSVDNTSSYIDEAFITKTFATGTGVTVGKKTLFIGGREYVTTTLIATQLRIFIMRLRPIRLDSHSLKKLLGRL